MALRIINSWQRTRAQQWEAFYSPLSKFIGTIFANSEFGSILLPRDMYQTHDGTTPAVALGDPIGRITDQSTLGYSALQPTLPARPVVGRRPANGRTNLFTQTEDLTASNWGKLAVTIQANADGIFDKIIPTAVATNHYASFVVSLEANTNYTVYIDSKISEYSVLRYQTTTTNGFLVSTIYDFNTVTGVITAIAGSNLSSASMTINADGSYRCAVKVTTNATAGTKSGFWTPSVGGEINFAGDGVSGILVSRMQISKTHDPVTYQTVGAAHNIVEIGQASISIIYQDLVDDALAITYPAQLGSNCTTLRIYPGLTDSCEVLTGQTIGTVQTINQSFSSLLTVNHTLTATELALAKTVLKQEVGL